MTSTLPPTTAIADVAAIRGRRVSLTPPLHAMHPVAHPLRGVAVTVSVGAGPGVGGLAPLYELLSADLDGAFLVIGGAAAVGAAVFGQIIARAAHQAGVRAVLLDGGVRDRALLLGEHIAVFAREEYTAGAVGLAHVSGTRCAVVVAEVSVGDGDIVVCDDGGAVCLRAAEADRLLAEAAELAAAEAAVLADLARGIPLNVAYGRKSEAVRRIHDSALASAQAQV